MIGSKFVNDQTNIQHVSGYHLHHFCIAKYGAYFYSFCYGCPGESADNCGRVCRVYVGDDRDLVLHDCCKN